MPTVALPESTRPDLSDPRSLLAHAFAQLRAPRSARRAWLLVCAPDRSTACGVVPLGSRRSARKRVSRAAARLRRRLAGRPGQGARGGLQNWRSAYAEPVGVDGATAPLRRSTSGAQRSRCRRSYIAMPDGRSAKAIIGAPAGSWLDVAT